MAVNAVLRISNLPGASNMMAEVSKILVSSLIPLSKFVGWRLSQVSNYRNSFNCQINWTVQCHLIATSALVMIGKFVRTGLMPAKPAVFSILVSSSGVRGLPEPIAHR
jgi:hypothetical protein